MKATFATICVLAGLLALSACASKPCASGPNSGQEGGCAASPQAEVSGGY